MMKAENKRNEPIVVKGQFLHQVQIQRFRQPSFAMENTSLHVPSLVTSGDYPSPNLNEEKERKCLGRTRLFLFLLKFSL